MNECSPRGALFYNKGSFYYKSTPEGLFMKRGGKRKMPLPRMPRLGAHRLDIPTYTQPFLMVIYIYIYVSIYICFFLFLIGLIFVIYTYRFIYLYIYTSTMLNECCIHNSIFPLFLAYFGRVYLEVDPACVPVGVDNQTEFHPVWSELNIVRINGARD